MKKTAICFTGQGRAVLEKLNSAAVPAGISPVEISEDPLDIFVKKGFEEKSALIFVGAVGIAVRSIAPYVKDKLADSPVIVIDDMASFVIPILSGHAGGANKIAKVIADLLDASPVITTSTDVNSSFSVDVFATENNLRIRNRDGIKKVSSKALRDKAVTISVKDYPPKNKVDVIIADDTDREYDLLLSPKRYVVGVGFRKEKDPDELEDFVLESLKASGIDINDVYAFATIDVKEKEEALIRLRDRYRIPVIAFESSLLEKAVGDFSSSEFVKQAVGVDNVCERAASLAAGEGAKLVVSKLKGDGMTLAVAEKRYG